MDNLPRNCLLTINGGSSSIKYALYEIKEPLNQLLSGEMEGIWSGQAQLHFTHANGVKNHHIDIPVTNHTEAAEWLFNWLQKETEYIKVTAIGHRIVQGMKHTAPEKITDEFLAQLKAISAFDPEHLPAEIELIEVFRKRYPDVDQVACFDTYFHTSMPAIAKLVPIPRKYRNKGIKRYGFHGLSYAYLLQEFERIAGTEKSKGKIIVAHLGSGASMVAIKNGKSIDTSMGFTPASGLTMSTRTGDLDPGVAWYLQQFEKLSPAQFNHMVNHESGLLAISGTTADMQQLLKIQQQDSRATEAVDFFCYQCIKWIGAFTAVLGGLDTLIFSGGIGEHSPEVRSKICDGLEFLGIELDEVHNMNNTTIISTEKSRTPVYMMHTNEELMIAQLVCDTLKYNIKQ
ncbi:acetate/propionate family kinase [Pedobacter arcticus]|uniref:acetate/propionate family kinase n=1 Tax=Pedobacter arcticus TaxID=752140 RepID=UPI00031191A9|nr:acetate/propionate family kinase [Pedobacter arcticus]